MWNFGKSLGDVKLIEAVADHIEKHIGKIDTVFHEKVSPTIHVDVNVIFANERRPYHTLVTSGMAELPMPVPREIEGSQFAEVMICLPKEWPIDPEHFKDENFWWPIRQLKTIARFPHINKTWLYSGHSMINEDEKPFASGTQMCSVVLMEPRTVPKDAHVFAVGKKKYARLWAIVPLYREELELKLNEGFEALEKRLNQPGINEILNPNRTNAAVQLH